MSSSGPNTVLWASLQTLRARIRELTRNNPNAESGVESWVSNLIGTGLTPRWKIQAQELKTRKIAFVSDKDDQGPRHRWTFHKVQINSNGDINLVAEKQAILSITGSVLAEDTTQPRRQE